MCVELTGLKQERDTAWLREMESQSLQQALHDLERAFLHFFRRVKHGAKEKGYPTFKSKHRDTPRFRIPQRVQMGDSCVSIPKIGIIQVD
ncbi:MAG: hypothetical protein SH847_03410 [Roseiflexaceae bacterium]|nr:hypothetical protein [Roseiflexaceae bacterium]